MPRLRLFGGTKSRRGAEATRRPRRVISPASGRSSPATSRRVVVLPQPLGPSRVKTSPRRISSDVRSTAAAGAEQLADAVEGEDRLAAVGRRRRHARVYLITALAMSWVLTTSGRFSSASTWRSFAPLGTANGRVARLDADAAAVRLDLARPDDLGVLGEQPVDEHLRRIRDAGALLTSHSVLLLELTRVHLREVEELEVLAEALLLELAQQQRVDAERDGIAAPHHELGDLAGVAAQHRLLVDEQLLDDVVAQVEPGARHRPERVAHRAHVGQQQLALPLRDSAGR